MVILGPVQIGWNKLERTLNKIIASLNARGITRGPCILTRESTNGTMISLDLDAVTVLINDAIAAAIAAKKNSNSSANDPTGGGSGGGGGGGTTSPTPGSDPGTDQSGSGDPGDTGTWSFNDPQPVGDGVSFLYPNQQNLSSEIDYFVITQIQGDYFTGHARSMTVFANGTSTGFFGGIPPGDYWFTIAYHYKSGAIKPGISSPAFSLPPGGASIILGNNSFFIPNP
jgi:hypothetical protein